MRRFIACLAATLAFVSVSFVWRSEELPSYAKLLTGAGVIPANADVAITEANFPDDTFRAYVSSNFDTDENGTLSDEEIEAATIVDVGGSNISSLNGIEYFTALTILVCYNNQLTALDVSKNTALTYMYCGGNQLTTLDVSKNTALYDLSCTGNQLTALDVSNNTALYDLSCFANQLTALDVSNNTALTRLDCEQNRLTVLDLSKNTALTVLHCAYNQLTELDLSNNTALTALYCYRNQLTALDVSKNIALENLDCGVNQLTALDVSNNTALTYLECDNNQLTALGLSNNTALTSLLCEWNQLTELDVSNNTALTNLHCYTNQLTALDLSNNTALTELNCGSNQLTELDLSNNTTLTRLYCNNNQLTELDLSKNTALTYLSCAYNQLTALDVSNNTALEDLYCEVNQLTTLDVSNNTALKDLYCEVNQLTALDVSSCTALTYLNCWSNLLTELDVSKNTALTGLSCYVNLLTELDVSNNTALEWLRCGSNQLTTLDVSNNTALEDLYCGGNQLTTLDMSNNTALEDLSCGVNQLTELDVSKNTALEWLDCGFNQLTELDLSNNTALTGLSCSSQTVYGLQITSSDNSSYPYQLSFSDYMSPDKFPNISYVQGITSGYMGISTLYSEGIAQFASKPAKVTYNYATGYGTQAMDVTISRVASEAVTINAENFPDDTFRAYVSSNFDTDGNGSLSDEEIEAATWINVAGAYDSKGNISSLKGIEYFTALTELYCSYNQLTTLDVSKNTALTALSCYSNQLTELDVSNNTALIALICYSNQLTELDVSNNTALTNLGCSNNQLTELDVSDNTALTALSCYENQLTALDLSKNTALEWLHCGSNQLTALDLSNNTALTTLYCDGNQLTALDLSNNTALTFLHCGFNQLTALDLSNNTALTTLWCFNNQLTALNVSGCTALTYLYCQSNQLTTLDVRSCPDVEIDCDTGVTIIRSDNAKPEILTDSLPGGITGTYYSVQLQYSGTTPITWTHKGSFPTGLTLNSDGLISGTPKKAGNFTFTVTAKNKYGTYSKKYTVKVIDPVSITTASLKAGTHEKSYTVTMKAKGTKPITWSATGLPDGLTINASTGKISGKPTAYGNFSVKITAENEAGSVTRTLALTVKAVAPTLSGSLKQSTFNVPYSSGLKVKGSETITWSISGELPEGLTFDTSTGIISGTPKSYGKNGNFKITITASNPGGSKSKSITFKVKASAPKLSGSLKQSTLNVAYSSGLKVKGTEPITWSMSGELPDGLTFDNSTGIISGTPKEYGKNGSFKIKITATNPVGSRSKNITLKVKGTKPTITAKLPAATRGEAYSATLTARGSDPITFEVDKLPAGLSLNDGVISGIVTETAKSFKFTVYATNPVKTVKKSFTLKINTPKSKKETPSENTENDSDSGTPSDNSDNTVEPNVTDNTETQTGTQTQGTQSQTQNQKSGVPEGYVIVAELGTVSRDEAGMYDFDVTLSDDVPAGAELMYIANSDTPSDDDEIAEFFDSTGNEITAVPKDRKISVSVWLNPDTIYHPAIAVKN